MERQYASSKTERERETGSRPKKSGRQELTRFLEVVVDVTIVVTLSVCIGEEDVIVLTAR